MNALASRIVLAVAATVLFAGTFACTESDDSSDDSPAGELLVAIGDSVAAGNGSSDPATTSFAAVVAEREGLTLENFAVAGATTMAVIDEQLPAALALIDEGGARIVIVSAGGNDLAALIPNAACVEDPPPAACPLDDALGEISTNVRAIIGRIRDVDDDVPIVLLAYPNFFAGTGHAFEAPAGRVLPRLGESLDAVAAEFDRVAVAHPDFGDRGGELTHVLDPQFDPHPSDAGHDLIAGAVITALDDIGR